MFLFYLRTSGIYKVSKKRVGSRNDYCPACESVQMAEELRSFDLFHVSKLPIVPLGFYSHWRCSVCGLEDKGLEYPHYGLFFPFVSVPLGLVGLYGGYNTGDIRWAGAGLALIALACGLWLMAKSELKKITCPSPDVKPTPQKTDCTAQTSLPILPPPVLPPYIQPLPIDANSTQIDRKTFALCLPHRWKEDTNNSEYNPDHFVFFESPDNAGYFFVMVRQNTAIFSADSLVNRYKETLINKMTDATIADIGNWSDFHGKGFVIEGTLGNERVRATTFGVEKGDKTYVVQELISVAKYETYATDFQLLRRTFRLK